MNMSGNTILITGGATGIGLALAAELRKAGNEVIICGRRENKLKEAQDKAPGIRIRACDVSVAEERVALRDWAVREHPDLNVLVNNAGIQRDVNFLSLTEDWARTREEIAINVEGPMHLSALFIPHLRGKPNAAILNVSSGLAFTPMALFPIYCATKAAVHSFSMTLRHQLRDAGIEVVEIIPPAVDSELNLEGRSRRGMTSTGVTAEEFAAAVMQGLERGDPEVVFGHAEQGRNASRAEIDEAFRRMNR